MVDVLDRPFAPAVFDVDAAKDGNGDDKEDGDDDELDRAADETHCVSRGGGKVSKKMGEKEGCNTD